MLTCSAHVDPAYYIARQSRELWEVGEEEKPREFCLPELIKSHRSAAVGVIQMLVRLR